jgi:hypothetical protein
MHLLKHCAGGGDNKKGKKEREGRGRKKKEII